MTVQPMPTYQRSMQRLRPVAYSQPETYLLNRAQVEMAMTLIPDAYTSVDFYDMEQERVFAKSWVYVACLSDFKKPGDTVVARVAGQSVVVVQNKQGQLRAFYNVCRHRGAKLVEVGCTHLDQQTKRIETCQRK